MRPVGPEAGEAAVDCAALDEASAQWWSSCNSCVYDCDRAPSAAEIVCLQGKCADSRYP